MLVSVASPNVRRPELAVVDGNPGLLAALQMQWPGLAVQRCTAHKLRNLQAKAPARLREELTEEYRRLIYAETVTAVEQARRGSLRSGVVLDLRLAGEESAATWGDVLPSLVARHHPPPSGRAALALNCAG